MKDELKIFIESNRQDFEIYKLDLDKAWSGIDTKLIKDEHVFSHFSWRNILKVAAVLIFLITVSLSFYVNNLRISRSENGIALHNISSDLADTEAFYTSQIDEKLKLIGITAGGVGPDLKAQLEGLDEDYNSLKSDLIDDADSEEVINAMIKYYRLKLAMLVKILDEVQKNNDNEEAQAI